MSSQSWFWNLKLKSNKLVDFSKRSLNMVVFGLKLFIFWSWFQVWTQKYEFPKFLIFVFLYHYVHCIAGMSWKRSGKRRVMKFQPFWAQNAIKLYKFWSSKNKDINLMIINFIFYQNFNFLATHVRAQEVKMLKSNKLVVFFFFFKLSLKVSFFFERFSGHVWAWIVCFWNWCQIWTQNITTTCIALLKCRGKWGWELRSMGHEISTFLAWKCH